MEQFEKVQKGLECCSQMSGEACKKCPYANECEEGEGLLAGSAHLAANALSLIQQQQEKIKKLEAANASWQKFAPFLYAHGLLNEMEGM